MMDIDGPGVVYRTWSANPMGKLRIYLDGAQTPSYQWNFPDLFDGKLPPFIKPLVYRPRQPTIGLRLLSADSRLPNTSRSPPTSRMASTTTSTTFCLPEEPIGCQFSAALERHGASCPGGGCRRVVASQAVIRSLTPNYRSTARRPSLSTGQTVDALASCSAMGIIRAIPRSGHNRTSATHGANWCCAASGMALLAADP